MNGLTTSHYIKHLKYNTFIGYKIIFQKYIVFTYEI